ncbi:MAG TPA: glycosyltransferase family 1 protein [Chloroflexota bacterium]|nr:glycosyltransferase family 1 protein [Chloroflexota bacterium]
MRIAIEALGIEPTGGGRSATRNLLESLFAIDSDNEYVLFVSQAEVFEPSPPNVKQVIAGRMPAWAQRLWAQAVIPFYTRHWGADLLHHVKNLTVVGAVCPVIVTVYDLTVLRFPQFYPWLDGWYWRHVQPRALRSADRIIAISRTTASDLVHFYHIPAERIVVIYPSYNARLLSCPVAPEAARERYSIKREYILHVGSISQKKNLLPLLRAYVRLRRAGIQIDLVLVGRRYQKGRDVALESFLKEMDFADGVIMTGPVPAHDLAALYRGASVLVFPSLHEGFGIVPVEAMACGVPVVSSPGGALGEVVGAGGWLLSDPGDEKEIAQAIEAILCDDALRADLVRRGYDRAKMFTPERAARQTLDLYRAVTHRSPTRHGP